MSHHDARPFDADNHYYETLDSCTRHLDKRFADRGVKPIQDGKRVKVLMGGKVNGFIPNPTFDPIIVPGCLDPLFRGQIPEGVDPRSLMQVEPLGEHPEYQGRERAPAGHGRAGPRCRAAVPDLRLRGGAGAEGRRPRHHGDAVRVQPVAGGRLGLRPRRSTLRCRHALLRRPRRCRRRGRLAARARRPHHPRPSRAGARRQRNEPLARRQAPRPGVGSHRRSRRAGGLPPRRQRLRGQLRLGVGQPGRLRLRQERRPRRRAQRGPGHPRHDRVARRARRVHPPPDAPGRQHRERLGLGPAAGEAPQEEGQPGAVGVRRGRRSTPSAGTSGPPRTSRRTSTRWPT